MTEYVFSDKAKAFADRWASQETVLAQVKLELFELGCDPEDIIFHTVTVDGDWDRAFMVIPMDIDDKTVMLIDVAVMEETVLDAGPFKGKAVKIPTPGSE
jgi:hypothetical protein